MTESWVDPTALLPDGLPFVGGAAEASVPRCRAQFYAQQRRGGFQFAVLDLLDSKTYRGAVCGILSKMLQVYAPNIMFERCTHCTIRCDVQ